MDPDVDDEQAMAEALGFSSFGMQDRPQKKRRYNPHADAVIVDKPENPNPTKSSSGANSTPLGAPSAAAQGVTGANGNEIDLDDDELDQRPPKGASSEGAQDLTQVRLPGGVHAYQAGLPQRPTPGPGSAGPGPGSAGPYQQGGGRQNHQAGSWTNQDEREWYEGYYDHSSNANPWDRLEKSLGLQSTGTWQAYMPPTIPRQGQLH